MTTNLKLFEIDPTNKETCKNCINRERWRAAYGDKVFQYCRATRSNRTKNGLLKIKLKTPACSKFEKS